MKIVQLIGTSFYNPTGNPGQKQENIYDIPSNRLFSFQASHFLGRFESVNLYI